MIAEVIINSNVKNLNKTFDYEVPENLAGTICVGSRVFVPFGNKKLPEEGFVIGFKEESSYELKQIQSIEEGNDLTKENIELAKLMARKYFCNIADCIKLMLPPGTVTKNIENRVSEKVLNFVYLKKDIEEIEEDIENKSIKSEKQIRILNFLKENDGSLISDIEMFTDTSRAIVKTLEKNGYVEIIEKAVERNPFINKKDIVPTKKLQLTNQQKMAYDRVEKVIQNNEFEEFLLYGVTGSRENGSLFAINRKCIK